MKDKPAMIPEGDIDGKDAMEFPGLKVMLCERAVGGGGDLITGSDHLTAGKAGQDV